MFSTTLLLRILIVRESIRVLDARYRIFIDGFTGSFEYCLNLFFPYACISLVALFVSYFISLQRLAHPRAVFIIVLLL